MRNRWMSWSLGVVAIAAVAAMPALAQPGKGKGEERREDRKERREDRREDGKERREERRDERADKKDDIKDAAGERREKRQERRKERRDKLKEKWGDLVSKAPVKVELAKHGRRVARLERMLAVAEEEKKDDAVKRIKELLEKENARHTKKMEKLKEKGGVE